MSNNKTICKLRNDSEKDDKNENNYNLLFRKWKHQDRC